MNTVVLVTTKNQQDANKLARSLLENELVACVNIIPKIKSMYRWEGKVESSSEALMIIKTTKAKVRALTKFVKANHAYEVPEIISLDIKGGNNDYLKWISDSVK